MKNVTRLLSVVGLIFVTSCSKAKNDSIVEEIYPLNIAEPSGLSYSADKQSFYTVSDRGTTYNMSLEGNDVKQLSYSSEDFEGITVNPDNSHIYVVKERVGELVELDVNGRYLRTFKIIGDSGNSGLEGVSYDAKRDLFYLLKEKNKGLLITYSLSEGVKNQIELEFAGDYSGIYYNTSTDKLWIVSDESNTLTKCDLDGNEENSYKLGNLQGIEGVVVNDEETEAYIVSDPNNKLYKINLLE